MTSPQHHRSTDARIFEEIYPSLWRFAAAVRPPETDPDDLLQEAVARRLRHGPLADLDDPAAYLKRTILNLASNLRRHFAARRRALALLAASVTGSSHADHYRTETAAQKRAMNGRRRLHRVLVQEG
jgi:DNA-directed RNA polymerase specialized sigma24 family protein